MKKTRRTSLLIVLALILGPMAESEFRRSMAVFHDSIAPFFQRPLSLAIMVLIALSVLVPLWSNWS